MVKVALYVRLEALAGKEHEVEKFLRDALPIVQQETGTTAWFAIRMGGSTFGIFDAFMDEAGRQTHLTGSVAAALMAKAPELFAKEPAIEKLDVLAAKLPPHAVSAASAEVEIPLQVGSEFRIRSSGEFVVDNPELELAADRSAADAVLAYKFDRSSKEHVLRLLEPVADHRHVRVHRRGD
jgi:quinol monooxygenase YgiN